MLLPSQVGFNETALRVTVPIHNNRSRQWLEGLKDQQRPELYPPPMPPPAQAPADPDDLLGLDDPPLDPLEVAADPLAEASGASDVHHVPMDLSGPGNDGNGIHNQSAVKRRRYHLRDRDDTRVQQTMVLTCRTHLGCGRTVDQCSSEEVAMPLAAVDATDQESLGRGILSHLESWAFGMSLLEMLRTIAGLNIRFFVFAWSGDAASSNIALIQKYNALIRAVALDSSIAMFCITWGERCWLHQLARIMLVVLTRLGLDGFLKACGKITRHSKVRQQLRDCHRKSLTGMSSSRLHKDCPGERGTIERHNATLMTLLKTRATSELYHESQGGPQAYADEDLRNLDLDALFQFFQGVDPVGPPFKPGAFEQEDDSLLSEAWQVVDRVVWQSAIPCYMPSRWLKQRPFVVWASKLLLFTSSATNIFTTELMKAVKGSTNQCKAHTAKYIEKCRAGICAPTLRWKLATLLHTLTPLDRLAYVLFFCAEFTCDSEGRRVWRGVDKPPEANRSSMSLLVEECKLAVGRVWQQYESPSGVDNSSSGMADRYWPAAELCESQMRMEKFNITTTILAEFHHRFLMKFTEEPYCCWDLECDPPGMPAEAADSSPAVAAQAKKEQMEQAMDRFLDRNACDVKALEPMRQYINTADEHAPDESKLDRFQKAKQTFLTLWQGNSLKHENLHSANRACDSVSGKPQSLVRRAANFAKLQIVRLWKSRGGRNLAQAPSYVRTAFRATFATVDRVSHCRPNALGDPSMKWAWEALSPQAACRSACVLCEAPLSNCCIRLRQYLALSQLQTWFPMRLEVGDQRNAVVAM